jgi:hypothetical protein
MKRRAFTVPEANALLPRLREILNQVQALREVVAGRTDSLKILDVIWGRGVADPENPDHADFKRHRRVIGGAVEEIERLIREEILALGVRFPQGGIEHGLLDFPTILDGRWVYLCWQESEKELQGWHELTGGFAGRKPLTSALVLRMGLKDPGGLPWEPDRDG